ncbi:hypothetical protein AMECASPLE_019373, partial [Ameca splendens]
FVLPPSLSTLGDEWSRAPRGYLPNSTQPLHSVAPLAVKCNCGLCGIKTAFSRNHRCSETRTNARRRDRSSRARSNITA